MEDLKVEIVQLRKELNEIQRQLAVIYNRIDKLVAKLPKGD